MFRAWTTAALLTASVVVVLAPAARATTTTSFALSVGPVKVGTGPYRIDLGLNQFTGGAVIYITLARTAPTGNHPHQQHVYSFSLSESDFSCTSDLGSCTVNTGTDLGGARAAAKSRDYGKIDQTFKPTAAAATTQIKCGDGTVIGSTTVRSGRMSGPFTLNTFNSFFGTLTNAGNGKIPDHIPALAKRTFLNGKSCPSKPGRCHQGMNLFARDPQTDLSVNALRRLANTGNAQISMSMTEGSDTDPATISHTVSVVAPVSAFTAASNLSSASLDGNAGKPFITGSTSFAKQGKPTSNGTHCVTTNQPGQVQGDIAAHFDGLGTKALGTLPAGFSKTVRA